MACRGRPNHFGSSKDGLVRVIIIWVIISGVSRLIFDYPSERRQFGTDHGCSVPE